MASAWHIGQQVHCQAEHSACLVTSAVKLSRQSDAVSSNKLAQQRATPAAAVKDEAPRHLTLGTALTAVKQPITDPALTMTEPDL